MAFHPLQIFDCRVGAIHPATEDITIVHLVPDGGARLRFAPGQFASLRFADKPARDYSMANRPDEPVLEFHIRDTGSGGASGYVAAALRLGERVRLAGPFGDAFLEPDHRGPMLCMAAGSGLAPMKSIVETALALSIATPIHLYFGARRSHELYLLDNFEALAARHENFHFVPLVSDEPTSCHRRGTLAQAIGEDFPQLRRFIAYLAGPPTVVEAMRALLAARGLPPSRIRADPFFSDAEKMARGLPLTDSPLA